MNYQGVIIEESLENSRVLSLVRILESRVKPTTAKEKTPWVQQWTLHTVEIPEPKAERVAAALSASLDRQHAGYADFKNNRTHFIVFRHRIFRVNRARQDQYDEVKRYGARLGIPDYQLNFSPQIPDVSR